MGNELSRQQEKEKLYERPRLDVLQECVRRPQCLPAAPPPPAPSAPTQPAASPKVTSVRCPRDRRPAVFGRDEAIKPYSSPPPAPPPDQLAYSFVPEPPRAPTDYRQPMWRWMLQDVGRRTVGVARVDLIRPR